VLEALLVIVLLAAAVLVVSAPLRRGASAEPARDPELEALEVAKEAKYAEIREAELDHATGKLADADWRSVDAQLRAEAVEILRRIDARRAA
jgi:hypothetical protein